MMSSLSGCSLRSRNALPSSSAPEAEALAIHVDTKEFKKGSQQEPWKLTRRSGESREWKISRTMRVFRTLQWLQTWSPEPSQELRSTVSCSHSMPSRYVGLCSITSERKLKDETIDKDAAGNVSADGYIFGCFECHLAHHFKRGSSGSLARCEFSARWCWTSTCLVFRNI